MTDEEIQANAVKKAKEYTASCKQDDQEIIDRFVARKTVLDVVREYFPEIDEKTAEYYVWNETGYPAFWNIGVDGNTPMDCFRLQLARAASRDLFGEYGYLGQLYTSRTRVSYDQ